MALLGLNIIIFSEHVNYTAYMNGYIKYTPSILWWVLEYEFIEFNSVRHRLTYYSGIYIYIYISKRVPIPYL